MSKVVLLLLATSIGLGVVSLHLVHELRGERSNVQSLQTRIGELERVSPRHEAPPPASSPAQLPETASLVNAPAPFATAMIATVTAPTSAELMPSPDESMQQIRESMERQRTMLRDPEYRDAMRAQHKMMLAQSYVDLAQELGLDSDQVEELLTLLADQQLRSMENEQPWLSDPRDSSTAEEIHRKLQQQQRANEAEVATLLGQAKMQEWQDYQSTMGVRHEVTQLSGTLAAKGVPLQSDQKKPLLKALGNEQQRMMREWNDAVQAQSPGVAASLHPVATSLNQVELQEQELRRITKYNRRVRDAVAHILTSEQLRHFEEGQNQQLKIQQAQMRMMRVQAEAEARGEISGSEQSTGFAVQGFIDPAR